MLCLKKGMNRLYKRIVCLFLTVGWMMLIYYMSSKTATVSGGESTYIIQKIMNVFFQNPSEGFIDVCETVFRKLCHFGEYGVLSFFVYITFCSFGICGRKTWMVVAICFVYAVSDEIHQYFVPGRACRIVDILIDTSGACVMYVLLNFKRIYKSV